jgi:hypothetical protein
VEVVGSRHVLENKGTLLGKQGGDFSCWAPCSPRPPPQALKEHSATMKVASNFIVASLVTALHRANAFVPQSTAQARHVGSCSSVTALAANPIDGEFISTTSLTASLIGAATLSVL